MWLLQRAELTADLDEGGDGLVEVMAFVCGGELYADTCLALGDDGVVEARDVDPFFEEACSVFLRELSVVEHHGADSRLGGLDVEASSEHLVAEVLDVLHQLGVQGIAFLEHLEDFEASTDDCGRDGVTEEVGA